MDLEYNFLSVLLSGYVFFKIVANLAHSTLKTDMFCLFNTIKTSIFFFVVVVLSLLLEEKNICIKSPP